MRKFKFGFIIVAALALTGCKSHSEEEADQMAEDIVADMFGDGESSVSSSRCDEISIDGFDSFLGVDYDTKETDLKGIMGKATGGEYTDDKDWFIYKYDGIKRVPVTIYVDAETGEIDEIFMEILGLKENFDQDILKAEEDFDISECHLSLFGKQPKEVISIFGAADKDSVDDDSVEEGVRHLTYYTKDDRMSIQFKFYHSQDNQMSSLKVIWYH